jgi:hypothetical protein
MFAEGRPWPPLPPFQSPKGLGGRESYRQVTHRVNARSQPTVVGNVMVFPLASRHKFRVSRKRPISRLLIPMPENSVHPRLKSHPHNPPAGLQLELPISWRTILSTAEAFLVRHHFHPPKLFGDRQQR